MEDDERDLISAQSGVVDREIDSLQQILNRLPEIQAIAEAVGAEALNHLLESAQTIASRRLMELRPQPKH